MRVLTLVPSPFSNGKQAGLERASDSVSLNKNRMMIPGHPQASGSYNCDIRLVSQDDHMATILEAARAGRITRPITRTAAREGIDPHELLQRIADGSAVIMRRGGQSVGIGKGLRTKVNVNIGTSGSRISLQDELEKARIAERYGADTITDLSMGGDIAMIRDAILHTTSLPLTTVPIYEAAARYGIEKMSDDDILATIRRQAGSGVSSMVLHAVNNRMIGLLQRKNRVAGIVSKGGSITAVYLHLHGGKNPFIERFDDILDILHQYDIVLSLGNTARSGGIHDGRDRVQTEEMRINGELGRYARERGVQVIVEGAGGHVRYDRIAPLVRYYKKNLPFPLFVAGPLPTDIALGYDHIAGCAGASAASAAGADYLCYLTPSEHLGLPGPDQVKEGLIAFRIAAHIGDIVKYGLDTPDREMTLKRAALDRDGQFVLAMDETRARELAGDTADCSMCGDFCAIRLMKGISRNAEPEE
jgi:phosphomethylpyrimidine synthase